MDRHSYDDRGSRILKTRRQSSTFLGEVGDASRQGQRVRQRRQSCRRCFPVPVPVPVLVLDLLGLRPLRGRGAVAPARGSREPGREGGVSGIGS